MARINIEECWWSDPRRMKLAIKVGSGALADGVAQNAWRLAQEFWGKSRGLIPREIFCTLECSDALIEVGLADVRESFVYVRGSSTYLDWHAERREAARKAGQKSVESRRKKLGSAQPNAKKSRTKPEPNATKSNQAEPSDSGSLSDSGFGSGSRDIALAVRAPTPVGVYCDVYKARYGHFPEIGGKQSGIIVRFAKNHPDNWEKLIGGYLSMPDTWSTQRSHPVELLETKVNEIVRFLETGKVVTRKVVQHAEEIIDKAQGTNRRPRKSLDDIGREHAEMLAEAGAPMKLIPGGEL